MTGHMCSCCRPLLVEEFGLTKRFFSLEETKVVVAVVADALIAAKRAGKPLMAAWLWQAAAPGQSELSAREHTHSTIAAHTMSNCRHHRAKKRQLHCAKGKGNTPLISKALLVL